MTEKDVIIQDMRRELKVMKEENAKLKATIEEKDVILAMQRNWIDFLLGGKDENKA